MFYYIEGTVAVIEPYLAVIDCGGVGYAVHTSLRTVSALTKGSRAKLFTYCNIREDAFDIYGFVSQSELNSFKMLIGISGVGPKAAISVLSSSSPEDLTVAIVSGNEKALTVAPGIGKKIAQRIILELKDKMGKDFMELSQGGFEIEAAGAGEQGKLKDAASALTVLGYSPGEINAALKGLDISAMKTEDIIRQVLKKSLK